MRCLSKTAKGSLCKSGCANALKTCWIHSETCTICLEKLGTKDEVATLKCAHSFHAGCIENWYTSKKYRCPLCRTFVFMPHVVTVWAPIEFIKHTKLNLVVQDMLDSGTLPGDVLLVEHVDEFLTITDEFSGAHVALVGV